MQAGSSWAVGWKKDAFWGRDALLAERAAGPARRLRGLLLERPRGPRGRHGRARPGRPADRPDHLGDVLTQLKRGIALALIYTGAELERRRAGADRRPGPQVAGRPCRAAAVRAVARALIAGGLGLAFGGGRLGVRLQAEHRGPQHRQRQQPAEPVAGPDAPAAGSGSARAVAAPCRAPDPGGAERPATSAPPAGRPVGPRWRRRRPARRPASTGVRRSAACSSKPVSAASSGLPITVEQFQQLDPVRPGQPPDGRGSRRSGRSSPRRRCPAAVRSP